MRGSERRARVRIASWDFWGRSRQATGPGLSCVVGGEDGGEDGGGASSSSRKEAWRAMLEGRGSIDGR